MVDSYLGKLWFDSYCHLQYWQRLERHLGNIAYELQELLGPLHNTAHDVTRCLSLIYNYF